MVVYSQNDPAWKDNKIGFDQGPYDTIGNYGCYMTAIANVCSWAGSDINPQQINDICKDRGWLVSSDLVARDDVPSQLCSNLQFEGRTNWSSATPMEFFADASDPNVAYIICIDASKAPGIQTHFVMVWAVNGPNDLIIDDSWDGQRKSLTHYGTPSAIIQSATKFRKIVPVVIPTPEPVVVPEPVPAPPAPYVPPAAPIKGTPAERYEVFTNLPVYESAEEVAKAKNPVDIIQPGTYYVWSKKGTVNNYWDLSSSNMVDENKWINITDNKKPLNKPSTPALPPTTRLDPPELTASVANPLGVPATDPTAMNWRGTLNLGYAGLFVFYNGEKTSFPVIDLEGKNPTKYAHKGDYLQISGKFVGPDGKEYARPKNGPNSFMWYGVAIEDLKPYEEIYGTHTTRAERAVLHTLTTWDRIEAGIAKIKTIGEGIWDIVAPKGNKK
jgi:hypothetical protein